MESLRQCDGPEDADFSLFILPHLSSPAECERFLVEHLVLRRATRMQQMRKETQEKGLRLWIQKLETRRKRRLVKGLKRRTHRQSKQRRGRKEH
mmetsp:Transcript_13727/g.47556  ORF Transcript_13727/g.47556 Transcript_13727/m.47556 type:complete len:94 (+) Transcript_13727:163-444(+)